MKIRIVCVFSEWFYSVDRGLVFLWKCCKYKMDSSTLNTSSGEVKNLGVTSPISIAKPCPEDLVKTKELEVLFKYNLFESDEELAHRNADLLNVIETINNENGHIKEILRKENNDLRKQLQEVKEKNLKLENEHKVLKKYFQTYIEEMKLSTYSLQEQLNFLINAVTKRNEQSSSEENEKLRETETNTSITTKRGRRGKQAASKNKEKENVFKPEDQVNESVQEEELKAPLDIPVAQKGRSGARKSVVKPSDPPPVSNTRRGRSTAKEEEAQKGASKKAPQNKKLEEKRLKKSRLKKKVPQDEDDDEDDDEEELPKGKQNAKQQKNVQKKEMDPRGSYYVTQAGRSVKPPRKLDL